MNNPIWNSVEMQCWARAFDYADYCHWCLHNAGDVTPVSVHMYKFLCQAFDSSLEADIGVVRGENGEA